MIDVGICQKNACNWSVAWRIAARLQPRHAFDLPSQIRRRVDQEPAVKTFRVAADGDARLRLRRNLPGTRSRSSSRRHSSIVAGRRRLHCLEYGCESTRFSESDHYVRSNRACVAGAFEKDRNGFQHRFDPPLLCSSHKSHVISLSLHSTEIVDRSSGVS